MPRLTGTVLYSTIYSSDKFFILLKQSPRTSYVVFDRFTITSLQNEPRLTTLVKQIVFHSIELQKNWVLNNIECNLCKKLSNFFFYCSEILILAQSGDGNID